MYFSFQFVDGRATFHLNLATYIYANYDKTQLYEDAKTSRLSTEL